MTRHGSLRVTTWVAFADFFACLALLAFALYGFQRQKLIQVEEPIKRFVASLERFMTANHMHVNFDEVRSSLTLDEAVLFDRGRWEIKHPEVVQQLAESLRESADQLRSSGEFNLDQTRAFQLVIRGHADARPFGNNTNLWLAQQRARRLEESLATAGIHAPDFQVSSQSVGEWEPVVDNCVPASPQPRAVCPDGRYGDDAALAPNRRIELRFGYFSGSARTTQVASKPLAPKSDRPAK